MTDPLILCICPTNDTYREYLPRAVRSFQSQTYENKRLLIWDTSSGDPERLLGGHLLHHLPCEIAHTVGGLRNDAIEYASLRWSIDYIAHFDADDWSHPDRLRFQIQTLRASSKQVTGFYEMAVWDSRKKEPWIYQHERNDYGTGTSYFYKFETWQRVHFPERTPEDLKWRLDVGLENILTVSGFTPERVPLLIQDIHGKNGGARLVTSSPRYRRANDREAHNIREIMANA